MALYKFRSLQNLRRFLDILVKKRLYMAHYDEMNDPMEGAFLLESRDRNLLNSLWEGKRKMLICSFSQDYRNTLLWSHYADCHRGCCLEVEVISKLQHINVQYSSSRPDGAICNPVDILSHKSNYWEYEKEVRYFKEATHPVRPYLSIKINKIFLGYKMSRTDVSFYTSLIKSILGANFPVQQMRQNDLDTGFIL